MVPWPLAEDPQLLPLSVSFCIFKVLLTSDFSLLPNMQLRYIIFFSLCWLLLNKALKEIQSKEKKLKSKWKKSYMKNYIWGRGGSQRLLKVIMCFRSINCIINHHSRAEPSEPAKTEQSEVSMVVYLWPGQLIGERQCLWREAGGIWNCPVFIRGILHK